MIYHDRQYATADNVFDYFANYQVISESGQCVFSIADTIIYASRVCWYFDWLVC